MGTDAPNISKMTSFDASTSFNQLMQPFPPHARWKNAMEMLVEVFADLEIPWVQNYVLRSTPQQDGYALMDPYNYSRAISLVYRGKNIPSQSGGIQSMLSYVRLNIPVICVDGIGVGIGIYEFTREHPGRRNSDTRTAIG